MQIITEYRVIETISVEALVKRVNNLIGDWKPTGGIFIAKTADSNGEDHYFQSMFKEE